MMCQQEIHDQCGCATKIDPDYEYHYWGDEYRNGVRTIFRLEHPVRLWLKDSLHRLIHQQEGV